jgi:hypothetical protein
MKFGNMCYYCHEEAATTLDHVLPASYYTIHDIDNLRPACALCNSIASDKVFPTEDDKRWYILDQRKKNHKLRHCFCTNCGIAYIYREQSPSLFLCAECYDIEYDTGYAGLSSWKNWIELHAEAGWHIDIYRRAGKLYRESLRSHSRALLNSCLVAAMRSIEAEQLGDEQLSVYAPEQ